MSHRSRAGCEALSWMRAGRPGLLALALCALCACPPEGGDDAGAVADAGGRDAATTDASGSDAMPLDVTGADLQLTDATAADLASGDSASRDATAADALVGDTSSAADGAGDAAGADSAIADAGTSDGAVVVTGPCATSAVLELQDDGDGNFSLSGSLSTSDGLRGSCASDYLASETVVRFVAPTAGRYRFSTAASAASLDSVLSLRSVCGEPLSELGCDDNSGPGLRSQLFADLAASETVYVIVDQYRGLVASAFTLEVDPIAGSAPVLASVDAYLDATRPSLGLVIGGQEADQDLLLAELELRDAAGSALPLGGFVPLVVSSSALSSELSYTSGDFAWRVALPGVSMSASATSVHVVVQDSQGRRSNGLLASLVARPSVAVDQACDARAIFDLCAANLSCQLVGNDHLCRPATAPSLSSALVFFNLDVNALGVHVAGSDAELDVRQAEVLLLDALGARIVGEDLNGLPTTLGPLRLNLAVSTGSGSFDAFGSARVGDRYAWQDATQAEVTAIDAAGLRSTPSTVAVNAPVTAPSGSWCDANMGYSLCPAGELCGYEPPAAPTCVAEASACPSGWAVVALDLQPPGGQQLYQVAGDSSAAVPLAGRGSCGGGGPQQVFSFTSPLAARWRFALGGPDASADTLLFARRACTAPQPEYELSCNDDVDLMSRDYSSAFELDLASGQTIYLFVDGHVGQSPSSSSTGYAGPYTQTATRRP
ncbi:MAG: hypothetical protein ABIJ09_17415 [Pseudomonadota bacterium]